MSLSRFAALAIAAVAFVAPAAAQEDAVGLPGPIVFNGTPYELAWTSEPSQTYAKQEYLPAGQTLERYEQMFFVDVLTEGATAEGAASNMVAALERRKAGDPLVNYELIPNAETGEYILDFTLSDTSTGVIIVEWNAYRYVPNGDGLALFAISRRGYDDEGSAEFIGGLTGWRAGTIEALAEMDLPEVGID